MIFHGGDSADPCSINCSVSRTTRAMSYAVCSCRNASRSAKELVEFFIGLEGIGEVRSVGSPRGGRLPNRRVRR
jgi:hypothetical protein